VWARECARHKEAVYGRRGLGHGVRRVDRSELRVMLVRFQVVFVSYVVASGGSCGHGRLLLRNEEAKPGCHPGARILQATYLP